MLISLIDVTTSDEASLSSAHSSLISQATRRSDDNMSCAPVAARCAVRAWVRDADGEGRGRTKRKAADMCKE